MTVDENQSELISLHDARERSSLIHSLTRHDLISLIHS